MLKSGDEFTGLIMEIKAPNAHDFLGLVAGDKGKKVTLQSAEEIILQSLSYLVADNTDYTGAGVVDSLKASKPEELSRAQKSFMIGLRMFANCGLDRIMSK